MSESRGGALGGASLGVNAPIAAVPAASASTSNIALIKWLTYLMFMMFAMTTDSVGVIIPQIIRQFGLSMTAAASFQYATMLGIAFAERCSR